MMFPFEALIAPISFLFLSKTPTSTTNHRHISFLPHQYRRSGIQATAQLVEETSAAVLEIEKVESVLVGTNKVQLKKDIFAHLVIIVLRPHFCYLRHFVCVSFTSWDNPIPHFIPPKTPGNSDLADTSQVAQVAMKKTYQLLAEAAVKKLTALRQQDESSDVADDENGKEMTKSPSRRRLWIAVAGAPGSGKSTVAEAVMEHINNNADAYNNVTATVIPMDGYHYSKDQLKDRSLDIKRRGASWTFDAEAMVQDMMLAKHATDSDTTTRSFPTYSRVISDPVPDMVHLKPEHDIVIVEGLYLLLGCLDKPEQRDVHEESKDDDDKDDLLLSQVIEHDEMWQTQYVYEEIRRWKPLLSLWDDTWFVVPIDQSLLRMDAEEMHHQMILNVIEDRLVKRTLTTWTPEKTALWGGGTALEAARRRTAYNDLKNARFVTCCARHAQVVVANAPF